MPRTSLRVTSAAPAATSPATRSLAYRVISFSVPPSLDFAEAMALQRAVYIASTGFGLGDVHRALQRHSLCEVQGRVDVQSRVGAERPAIRHAETRVAAHRKDDFAAQRWRRASGGGDILARQDVIEVGRREPSGAQTGVMREVC